MCTICRKNKVLMEHYRQKPYCLDCQMRYWDPVKDPKYKKLFKIPKKFYAKSYFLRNVRSYYDRNEELSKKQIDAFKKTVKEMEKEDTKSQ
ncbi:MAG: hypothetical protein CMH63_02540 [Nanoarchaeota archaeon]|nr:hypothetical protein [Nanoarchaeota archaeon]